MDTAAPVAPLVRRRILMVGLVAVLAGGMMLPRFGGAAHASVTVPSGVTVARAGESLASLHVSWKPVTGADHYTVSVFDGTRDAATVVAGDVSSLDVAGSGACARYRVRVSAVDADGNVATTSSTLVPSLGPGGVGQMAAIRAETGATATLTWVPPASLGAATSVTYHVRVVDMASGKTVRDDAVGVTKVGLDRLDASRQYSVKVTPINDYGSCITAATVLYGPHPSPPRSVLVERDSSTPSRIRLTWAAPAWSGYGPVTGYEVGYLVGGVRRWVPVKNYSAVITLSSAIDQDVAVRAISSDDIGVRTSPTTIARVGGAGTAILDPRITVTENAGVVTVTTSATVGSSLAYPHLLVSVAPTMAATGFRDTHVIANGATTATFATLPCGLYSVVVTGYGAGTEKEFGRAVVNRCSTGAITADLWKVVYGSATVKGNAVDVTSSGERRIMSTTTHTGQDMALSTTAYLHTGWGYGIWVRADTSAGGASVSGYSMQYDPGYANVSSFGRALLLRLWSKGSECGSPLALVHFPAGVEVYAPHRFMVVIKGDTLFASIDEKVVFNVASLSTAVKNTGCGMPAPTGTQIGFRTWSDTTATFTGTTLN